MKSQILRGTVALALCLAMLGSLAGCDKAEEAMKNKDLPSVSDLTAATDLTSLMSKAVETLGGIKDIESAKAALPALKDMDVDLGKIVSKVKEMSPEQKSKLSDAVGKAMPQLDGAIEKVTSLQGVGSIVGPTLDSFKDKFKSLM